MSRQFDEWLRAKNACTSAVEWCDEHPEMSVQELLSICPRGEWILWVYAEAGYAPDVLAPVAYRAATRAVGYAADALDRADVQHGLRGLVITDAESAQVAEDAARAAGDAEHKHCADDCRQMLPELRIEGDAAQNEWMQLKEGSDGRA